MSSLPSVIDRITGLSSVGDHALDLMFIDQPGALDELPKKHRG